MFAHHPSLVSRYTDAVYSVDLCMYTRVLSSVAHALISPCSPRTARLRCSVGPIDRAFRTRELEKENRRPSAVVSPESLSRVQSWRTELAEWRDF